MFLAVVLGLKDERAADDPAHRETTMRVRAGDGVRVIGGGCWHREWTIAYLVYDVEPCLAARRYVRAGPVHLTLVL